MLQSPHQWEGRKACLLEVLQHFVHCHSCRAQVLPCNHKTDAFCNPGPAHFPREVLQHSLQDSCVESVADELFSAAEAFLQAKYGSA